MAERITKAFLEKRVDYLAERLGIPRSRKEAIEKNREHYMHLDFYNGLNPKNPGYQINLVKVNGGGISHFMRNGRMTSTELEAYIEGIQDMFDIYPQMESWIKEPLEG